MKIITTIEFRDDTKQVFECVDNPGIGDWITLYLKDLERITIPRDAVKQIRVQIKK